MRIFAGFVAKKRNIGVCESGFKQKIAITKILASFFVVKSPFVAGFSSLWKMEGDFHN